LITGGFDYDNENILKTAELYDPSTNSFQFTGEMLDRRFDHSATLLFNGRVLIAGGFETGFKITDSAEIYNPATGTFGETGSMTDARAEQTATGVRDKGFDDNRSAVTFLLPDEY
jgi:hypothetical protein